MFGNHVVKHLSAYHHGEVSAEEARRIEAHLHECEKCRKVCDEIKYGSYLASFVRRVPAPHLLPPRAAADNGRPATRAFFQIAAATAGFVMIVGISVFLWQNAPEPPSWNVVRTDASGVERTERLRVGGALKTDSSSEARIEMADIGRLTVDPNTSIRLLETKPDEHRLALDRGKLAAFSWAPPRVFFVETPSAVAIDLGCIYTLEVEDDGSSLLHVTLGLVSLELNGRESMVPRGAFCRTRPGAGPGTPFFDDSSQALRDALNFLDFGSGPGRESALETVLRESRPRDTLTLWHLFPRLDINHRGRVYDRMAELVSPPPNVTRDGVITLNLEMLDAWREKLTQVW